MSRWVKDKAEVFKTTQYIWTDRQCGPDGQTWGLRSFLCHEKQTAFDWHFSFLGRAAPIKLCLIFSTQEPGDKTMFRGWTFQTVEAFIYLSPGSQTNESDAGLLQDW